ncbi:MAG: MarR family transcriptional regulator [Rhizobiales bacterium]|nr:MarR family transcriptional regulator [Hyphomicrobiales bacterium]
MGDWNLRTMKKRRADRRQNVKARQEKRQGFQPPLTVSHEALLTRGRDDAFRQTIYAMVQAFGRLQNCREAFGRALGLTGSQFAVLMSAAYQRHSDGVSIRALADHAHLAPTHVTTEVNRLITKGLLLKRTNKFDRRSVLVRLSPKAEADLVRLAPFVRSVNDLLFQGISKQEFETVSRFLQAFILNTENALGEIRRFQKQQDALRT